MGADVLATQGTKASATMIRIVLNRIISIRVKGWEICWLLLPNIRWIKPLEYDIMDIIFTPVYIFTSYSAIGLFVNLV